MKAAGQRSKIGLPRQSRGIEQHNSKLMRTGKCPVGLSPAVLKCVMSYALYVKLCSQLFGFPPNITTDQAKSSLLLLSLLL